MGSIFLKAPSQRPSFNPPDSILTLGLGFIYTGDREWLGWALLEWKTAPRESEGGLFSQVGCGNLSLS